MKNEKSFQVIRQTLTLQIKKVSKPFCVSMFVIKDFYVILSLNIVLWFSNIFHFKFSFLVQYSKIFLH